MNIGTLTIEMAANLARLQRDMDQAKTMVGGAMGEISRVAGMARAALGALGVGLSAAALANFVKGAIDAADQINKLSQRTSVAAESLSQLQYAAKLADVGTDSLTTGLKKLNVSIAEGLAGDKEKIALFKQLGITQQDLGKGTEAVMLQMADAYAAAKDGAGKTAISVALLGKAGDEMIPLMNGGTASIQRLMREADAMGLTISAKFAREAEEFNDNLTRIGATVDAVAISIAGPFVEAMAMATTHMMKQHEAGKSWLMVLLDQVEVLRLIKNLAGGGVDPDLPAKVNAMRQLRIAGDDPSGMNLEVNRLAAARLTRQGSRANGLRDLALPTKDDGSAARNAARAAAELKRELEAQAKVLAELNGYTATYNEELERLWRMHAAGALSLEQYIKAGAALQAAQPGAIAAAKARVEAAALANQLAEDAIELDERQRQATEAQIKSARTMLEQLQFETELLTMSNEQRALAIAQRELEAQGIVKGTVAYEAYIKKIREAVLRKEDVTKQVTELERQKEAWKGLWESIDSTAHDVFVNIFEGGQSAFKKIGNVIKASVLDLLYQITIKRWIISIGTSMGGGLANAAVGSAAGSLLGGAGGGIGDLLGLGNLFGGSGGGLAGIGTGLMNGLSSWLPGGSVMGVFGNAGLYTGIELLGAAMPIIGGLLAVASLFKGGETRGGGQYDYGITDMGNFGTAGAQFRSGPSGGQIAGKKVVASIDATIAGINNTLAALGSSQHLVGFQAALETSGNGRGGVYAGGTLSGGATFGDPGAGGGRSNYAGTLYDRSKSTSPDGEMAIKLLALDLKQATLQAIKAAADIPKSIRDQLKGIDLNLLSDDAATALLTSINTQIAAVQQFGAAMDMLPFARLRNLSFDATTALAKLAGGLEALTANLATFYENFYTEEEKRANTIRVIQTTLANAGLELSQEFIGGLSRAGFRELVEATAALGTAGQPAYTALLQVSGAFASITQEVQGANSALAEQVKQYRDMAASLRDYRLGLRAQFGQLSPEAAYAQSRQTLQRTFNAARGGDMAALERLQSESGAFLNASQGYNASGAQYFQDLDWVERVLRISQHAANASADVAQVQIGTTQVVLSIQQVQAILETILRQQIAADTSSLAQFQRTADALERISTRAALEASRS
jgi:hypothetical protein